MTRSRAAADVLVGLHGDDLLDGGDGADRFVWNVGDGADRIIGGAGADTAEINGTDGDDSFGVAASGGHVLVGSADLGSSAVDVSEVETISVNGSDGADLLTVGDLSATTVTKVVFDAGAGDDILDAAEATRALQAEGGAGDDTLIGGAGTDSLDGGAGNDVLLGADGADTLMGEGGDELLGGGTGADVFRYTAPELNNGIAEGDMIVDYSAAQGDKVDLPDGVSVINAVVVTRTVVVTLSRDG